MFIILLFIIIGVVIAIGIPLINGIAKPLVNEKRTYNTFRFCCWALLIMFITWPIIGAPTLFEAQCKFATELKISPSIDARNNGYFDKRLDDVKNIDQIIFDNDVGDLISGRISFFESKNKDYFTDTRPFLQYYLDDKSSILCNRFGHKANSKIEFPPGKCLAAKKIDTLQSKYTVSVSGNINIGDGTTKIRSRESDKTLALHRSFALTSILQHMPRRCPYVRIDDTSYSAHIVFTSMVFIDSLGRTKTATVN